MIASFTDFLSRKGKIILAVWLVLFLVMLPPALKSLDVMEMSMNGGEKYDPVIEKYFDIPYYDYETMPFLVVDYDTVNGYRQLQGNADIGLPCYSEYIIQRFNEDEKWDDKLDDNKGRAVLIGEELGELNGALIIGFNYIDTSDIKGGASELRSSIREYTDDYMYELFEKKAYFSTHLTGNGALSNDFESSILLFAGLALVISIIIALILIGLYFGSVLSAVIPAVSMILSVTLTNTMIFGLSAFYEFWLLPEIVMAVIVLVLSFAFSILIISNYRKELFDDNKHAIVDAVMKSKKPILATLILFFVSGLFLIFIPDFDAFFTIGLCIVSGSISVFIVIFTIPASLITLTKNEMFWIRTSDRQFKLDFIANIYDRLADLVDRFSMLTDRLCTNHAAITVFVVLVSIVASSVCIVVTVNDKSTEDDLTSTMYTGESLDGLQVLENYGYGGISTPYSMIMNFDEPVAHVVREIDILGNPFFALYWDNDVADDIWNFQDAVYECDDNICEVSSIVRWNSLVIQAKGTGLEDYGEIIQYIIAHTRWDVSEIISQEMERMKLIPDALIVEAMGPRIDYVVNQRLGGIGYEMLSDGQIIVKHIRVSVFTESCASTPVTIGTTDTLNKVAESAIPMLQHVESISVNGIAVSYSNSLAKLSEWTLPMVIGVFIIFILVLFFVWTGIGSALVMLISAIASLILTASVSYLLLQTFFPGDLSRYLLIMVPLTSEIVAMWFGFVMACIAKDNENTVEVKKQFIPMAVIISATIICTSVPFLFADATISKQIALVFITVISLDVVVIRMFLMPSLFTLMHFKKEYAE